MLSISSSLAPFLSCHSGIFALPAPTRQPAGLIRPSALAQCAPSTFPRHIHSGRPPPPRLGACSPSPDRRLSLPASRFALSVSVACPPASHSGSGWNFAIGVPSLRARSAGDCARVSQRCSSVRCSSVVCVAVVGRCIVFRLSSFLSCVLLEREGRKSFISNTVAALVSVPLPRSFVRLFLSIALSLHSVRHRRRLRSRRSTAEEEGEEEEVLSTHNIHSDLLYFPRRFDPLSFPRNQRYFQNSCSLLHRTSLRYATPQPSHIL